MKIKIRHHEFSINCSEEEETRMRRAGTMVEKHLERARRQFGVSDSERAALMAALMVAFDGENRHNNGAGEANKAQAQKTEKTLMRIDDVLRRTDFPAKA